MRFPSGSELELAHRVAARIDPYAALDLVSTAFFLPLANRVTNDPRLQHPRGDEHFFLWLRFNPGSLPALRRARRTAGGLHFRRLWRGVRRPGGTDDENRLRLAQMREATVQVELIPETRFASVTKVTADTVISLGSTLAVTTSLRVGQTQDRDVELALSVPETLPAGLYQLEVGSVAALGDDWGWDRGAGDAFRPSVGW